jgi:excisionase family DNA binding protein
MDASPPRLIVSLPELAKALNLPQAWLKAKADAGQIPHLRIGYRYRFNLESVSRLLAERAAMGRGSADAS